MKGGTNFRAVRWQPIVGGTVLVSAILWSLLLSARLPGGDVLRVAPAGFGLSYEGAPPAFFADLLGGGASGGAAAERFAPADGTRSGRIEGPAPRVDCEKDLLFGRRCQGVRSTEYIATPGEVGINYSWSPAAIGGQIFRTPSPAMTISVDDRNGPGVPVIVCQEYIEGGRGDICRPSTADVVVRFCSKRQPYDLSDAGFRPGWIRVIVDTVDTTCPMPGSTGTITVTW